MSTQVMLVTGGSRGIGAAIVRSAAQRGYDVAFTYSRDVAAAEQVANDVRALGRRVCAIKADMADEAQIRNAFAQVDHELGLLTVLVNNCAITGRNSRLDDAEISTLREVMNVNVLAPMICSREAVLRMSTKHGGAGGNIVLISSRAALYGSPNEYVWYAASKGAIDSFNSGLAREVGREGIRVNAISPGPIATEMHRPGRLESVVPNNPLGRAGTAMEVAEAVLFLTSPAASYINGANIAISGGV